MIRPRRSSTLGTALAFAATVVSIHAGHSVAAANAPAPASPPASPAAAPAVSTAPPVSMPAAPGSAGVAGSGPKFGVVGLGPATLPATLAAQLESAAATGLAASGAAVVGRELTARPAGSCDGPTCLQELARTSGARYLLRGTCVIEGSTYRVRLDLVDGTTGTVTLSRQDTCEICTEHDVVEATNIAASALKATFDRTARESSGSASSGGSVAYPPPAGVDLRAGHDHADQGPPLWLRVAPWVAFAAAAGAIGTGVYYLSKNNQPVSTSCNLPEGNTKLCTDLYATGLRSGLWLGAGAVAGALGVLALVLTPSAPAPASTDQGAPGSPHARLAAPVGLSLSPGGVSAWTRF